MKDELAEVLLAKVMEWNESDVASERPFLQAIAVYKYDGYQQFSPGMRFIESLAMWLNQFRTQEEKRTAYDFVKNRLIFISAAEMYHLVSAAYPDVIRSIMLRKAGQQLGIPQYRIAEIGQSKEFQVLRRQSLFLGLSDGAHIDVFRRSNSAAITYGQVHQTYEPSPERAEDLQEELRKDLHRLLGREPEANECRFKLLFLLDDFSGSGYTYLRKQGDDDFAGKVARLYKQLQMPDSPLANLLDDQETNLYLVLYLCTRQALNHLRSQLALLSKTQPPCDVAPVHLVEEGSCLSGEKDAAFFKLCGEDIYYDADKLEDKHTGQGGKDVKYGFGQCALPLVLFHNTPNNSVSLIWSYDDAKFRGLFPRVPRHKEAV